MNILLVEDDIDLLEFEEFFFKNHFKDATIELAHNGQEALDHCSLKCFDIIITDINMPIMNGFKFIENLNARYPDNFKKLYVLSGCIANEALVNVNITHYFSKPVSYDSVLKRIESDLSL